MTDAPSTPAAATPASAGAPPCPADEADWARGFAMRRLEMLGELAEIGLDVARAIERQANGSPAAPEAPVFQGDLGLAYSRVSRAVRLTLMLQAKLIEDLKASDAKASEARDEAEDRASPEHRLKARIERIVERLAETEHPDDDDRVNDLVLEAGERLDDEDLYGDLLERPLSEVVARLCKHLGLEPCWADLAEELWAVREVASGQPGWPLATYLPREAAGGGTSAEEPMVEGESGALYAGLSEKQRLQRLLADLDAVAPLPNSS